MAKEGDHQTNFNAKMIAVTPEQKQAYRVRNLQVDYQFAVRKLRQEMGLDRPHFASAAISRIKSATFGKVPTINSFFRLPTASLHFPIFT